MLYCEFHNTFYVVIFMESTFESCVVCVVYNNYCIFKIFINIFINILTID